MATTIGRVEFLVGLDGKKLAGEANRLGNEMANSGRDAGTRFGDEFESSFERRLSGVGKNFANEMRKTGDLAGEQLGTSIERKVRSSFQRMQDNLAEVLSDDEAFKKYAMGFDSVDDAVTQLESDMGELHKANRVYRDESGRMRSETFLLKKDMDGLTETLKSRGKVVQESIDQDKRWALEMEQLDASIARMLRTIGNTDDFEKASKSVGGTAAEYRRLRGEIDSLRDSNKLSIVQYEKAIDTLDRTREKVVANAKAMSDNAKAARDAADATERLDKATADIGRSMGDSHTFRDRVSALGSLAAATDEARDAIGRLEGLGASETRIEGLTRKLKHLHDEFDAGKDRPNVWMRVMDKAAQKVSSSWQRMDGTVKLVLGLILSAGPEVAALGSAAGAALIAVGGAATSMIIGVAGAVAVFSNLNQELSKAPDAMKPAIRSFERFKDAISGVSDVIAQSAFDAMGDSFDVLGKTVKDLEPALAGVGTALGKLVKGFAEGTKKGTDGFTEINEAIENAGPNLEALGSAAGTFGEALLRAFNRAQPLVEDMFAWIGMLADRFDAFTRSSDFAEWVDNAQRVWHAFGGTLDAVSKALSDLVTPEAVDNTVKLLENIERLAPALGNLLAVFGALDPIGLLVDIFADIGETMAPLTPMLVAFAGALNNIVEAVPAGVWVALAAGIALVAGKLIQLKLASLIAPAIEALTPAFAQLFSTLKPLPDAITGVSKGLSTLGKASVIGAVAVGAFMAAEALVDMFDAMYDVDNKAREAVASSKSFGETLKALDINGTSLALEDAAGALENLAGTGNFFTYVFGTPFNKPREDAVKLANALEDISPAMANLAQKDLPAAAAKFAAYTEELGASNEQVLVMLDKMPEFKKVLEDAAIAEDGTASNADLLRLALTGTAEVTEGSVDAFAKMNSEMLNGASGAELQADALELLTGKSLAALDAVEGVAEGITTLGSAFRDQQGSAIDYQTSLEDLNQSIADNGKVWDVTTDAGKANQQAILDLADSTLDLASKNYNLTGSAEDAAASIQAGRDAVIKAVEGMDLGGLTAEEYADKLGLIPGDVETLISANTSAGMEMANAFATRLYELGLIEVNPVLALDAVDAQAEAERIQGQLDGLTLNSYVTQLDANGDPVTGVVESTSRSLEGFAATSHTTTLDANGDPVGAVLEDTANKLTTYASTEYTTKLDANGDPAGAVLEKTANKMSTFGSQTFTPTLDVYNVPGTAKIDATKKKLDALDSSTSTPKIDAENSKATSKIKTTSDSLSKLDTLTSTPKIDVDNTSALNDTQAVKNKMDGLKNKTVYIDVITRNSSQDKRAAGGIAVTPTLSVWGEAGPEALVPLNRPLSMVDPAVRTLSAVAQGKMSISEFGDNAGGGGGSPSGPSRIVNIEPGAIVVQGSMAPEATATMTVNRIAERISA